jgi:hypothetical protein
MPMMSNDPYEDYEEYLMTADEKGYKQGWAYYRLVEKYGEDTAREVANDYEQSWNSEHAD